MCSPNECGPLHPSSPRRDCYGVSPHPIDESEHSGAEPFFDANGYGGPSDRRSAGTTASTSNESASEDGSSSSCEQEWVERLPFVTIEEVRPGDGIVICEQKKRICHGYVDKENKLQRFFRLDRPPSGTEETEEEREKFEREFFRSIDRTIPDRKEIKTEEELDLMDFIRPFMFSNERYMDAVKEIFAMHHGGEELNGIDDGPPVDGKEELAHCNQRRSILTKLDSIIKDEVGCVEAVAGACKTSRPSFIEIEENEWLCDCSQQRRSLIMPCDCQTSEADRARGIAACGEHCLNRLMMIECSERHCPCGHHCTNRKFSRRENAPLTPFLTEWKGWGVKAVKDLQAGQFVIEYIGEVLDEEMFLQRLTDYEQAGQRDYYFMSLDRPFIIDATVKGNLSRLINHSCDPNCTTQKWNVDGRVRIGIFTIKPIAAGTELSFDYRYETLGNNNTVCYCKAENCRGFIGSKCTNPAWLQRSASDDSSSSDTELTKKVPKRRTGCRVKLPAELKSEKDIVKLIDSMLIASSAASRVHLLNFILVSADSEPGCLRMLMENHGLSVLWSWMADMQIGDQNLDLQLRLIEVLERLVVKSRDELEESKLLGLVCGRHWALALEWDLEDVAELEDDSEQIALLLQRMVHLIEKRLDGRVVRLVSRAKALATRWKSVGVKDEEKGEADDAPVETEINTPEVVSERAKMYRSRGFRVCSTASKKGETPCRLPNKSRGEVIASTQIKEPIKLHKHFLQRAEQDRLRVEGCEGDKTKQEDLRECGSIISETMESPDAVKPTDGLRVQIPNDLAACEMSNMVSSPSANYTSSHSSVVISPSIGLSTLSQSSPAFETPNLFSPSLQQSPIVRMPFTMAPPPTCIPNGSPCRVPSMPPPNYPPLYKEALPGNFQMTVPTAFTGPVDYYRQRLPRVDMFSRRPPEMMSQRAMYPPVAWNRYPVRAAPAFPLRPLQQPPVQRPELYSQTPFSGHPGGFVPALRYSQPTAPVHNYDSSAAGDEGNVVIVEEAEIRHVIVRDVNTGEKKIIQQVVKKVPKTTPCFDALSIGKRSQPVTAPRAWKMARTDQGCWYYYDPVTRHSQWERPVGVPVEGDMYSPFSTDQPSVDKPNDAEDAMATSTDDDSTDQDGNSDTKKLTEKPRRNRRDSLTAAQKILQQQKKKRTKIRSLEQRVAAATGEETPSRPSNRDTFKADLSKIVLKLLKPYTKKECVNGRITCNEDFKYLARKFTHSILEKEEQRCLETGRTKLEISKRVRVKTAEYVKKYMSKFAKEYSRKHDKSE